MYLNRFFYQQPNYETYMHSAISTSQFIFPPDMNCDFDRLYDEIIMNGKAQAFNACEVSQKKEVEYEDAK